MQRCAARYVMLESMSCAHHAYFRVVEEWIRLNRFASNPFSDFLFSHSDHDSSPTAPSYSLLPTSCTSRRWLEFREVCTKCCSSRVDLIHSEQKKNTKNVMNDCRLNVLFAGRNTSPLRVRALCTHVVKLQPSTYKVGN